MDIDSLEQRQAVAAWRDRLTLATWALVNAAGQGARQGLEAHLKDAAIKDTLLSPASFSYERIDGAMRATLAGGLRGLFEQAAEELRAINPVYGPLAEALVSTVAHVALPTEKTQPAADDGAGAVHQRAVQTRPAPTSRFSVITGYVSGSPVAEGAREWGTWALDAISGAADAASQRLQSGAGLHDRLRRAAVERIATAWMGGRGNPRPVMAQLVSIVDDVTNEARSMAL